jgi:membrane fusion protein, multidrug efflux system
MRHLLPAALLLLLLSACSDGNQGNQQRQRPAFPVEVETIEGRHVEYVIDATGGIEAFEEVLVTARVSGVVERVHFREGDRVDTEMTLVEIEPSRFQNALEAAKAQNARAVAELADVEAGLRRREGSGGNIFSPEEVEAWRTRVAVASANAREKAADLEQARLDLRHATPKSPIEGTVESRNVSTGQYVQAGTTITRLLRRDPMMLRFSIPERDARQVQPGQEVRFSVHDLDARRRASIVHVASSADRRTRMVDVLAEITGDDAADLTPGAYARRVQVRVGERDNAPTIPETAIRPSERGFLVYVIEDGTAHQRVVELGLRTPDRRVEVRTGLEPGEVLVIRGSEALRDGVPVRITNEAEDGPSMPDVRS